MISRGGDRKGFSRDGQAVMVWLLLLVLGLRSLLAPGVMPAHTADVPFPLIICTAQGLYTLNPNNEGDGQTGQDHAPCLFAAAGFLSLGAVGCPVLTAPFPWPGMSWPLPLLWVVAADHGWVGLARGPPSTLLCPRFSIDCTG